MRWLSVDQAAPVDDFHPPFGQELERLRINFVLDFEHASGDKDVFVHISAVERAGLSTLNEGQTVEYELVTGRNGKTSAENLKVG